MMTRFRVMDGLPAAVLSEYAKEADEVKNMNEEESIEKERQFIKLINALEKARNKTDPQVIETGHACW